MRKPIPDKGREEFLAAEPSRRAAYVERARPRQGDTEAIDTLFECGPGERDITLARYRAGCEFDAQERVLLAIEEWGGKYGPMFPGGSKLSEVIARFREGKCDAT